MLLIIEVHLSQLNSYKKMFVLFQTHSVTVILNLFLM